MSERHLHIVAFDIPYPPNYGGVIDIYYKLFALSKLGVQITLHCFQYRKQSSPELEALCTAVYYYPRNNSKRLLFDKHPYVVITRKDELLLERLQQDESPILFEGLHCCFYLADPSLKHRFKMVRAHNVEHDYYNGLANAERKLYKRTYFLNEAKKLARYERVLKHANAIAAISPQDLNYFQSKFSNCFYIPAFHANEFLASKGGSDKMPFALYHGNLSVSENENAAWFLVNDVFDELQHELVIAGNGASAALRSAIAKKQNMSLISDADPEEIIELVRKAQINLLPTFQSTGIKLKLLTALFNGGHCLVNTPMVEGTGLASLCYIADDAVTMKSEIEQLMSMPYKDSGQRKSILEAQFSTAVNAKKMIEILF